MGLATGLDFSVNCLCLSKSVKVCVNTVDRMMSSEMIPSASVTSQRCKRHRVAVTQLILIMGVYVISFLPVVLLLNDVTALPNIGYVYFINHVGNFFIYLAVNSEFRKQVKQLVTRLKTACRGETVLLSIISS